MKVLVVGSGGREHALVWKIAQSPKVDKIYAYPGNPGIFELASPLPGMAETGDLAAAVKKAGIDLTVIGPEDYLANGLVDELESLGCLAFGPTQAGAKIESSKTFAKKLMQQQGIPTARYLAADNLDEAVRHIEAFDTPLVVKADGLAAGKGVLVTDDRNQAKEFVKEALSGARFGAAGSRVLIEEFLEGEEISALAFVDGETAQMMPLSQDHKAAFDNDQGPNTGGMGAVAPVYQGQEDLQEKILQTIILPALKGLRAMGTKYRGVLYAGLMMTASGPKVLEFNCRFGDPETEVLMPLLDTDIVDIMLACTNGQLGTTQIQWKRGQHCACVVAVSEGYPGPYSKGHAIHLPTELPDGVVLFHNGTGMEKGQLVTAGGRVLTAAALGSSLSQALQVAYRAVESIDFTGMRFRKDIGAKQLGSGQF